MVKLCTEQSAAIVGPQMHNKSVKLATFYTIMLANTKDIMQK